MSLLNLIEENHTVWLAANSLGQLATLVVSYIPRRRSNQTGDTELFLILTHIYSGHHRLVVEEILGKRLGKFGLTYTGGTEEDEAGDRTLWILQAGTAAANGIAYGSDCLVLTDDSLVEFLLQMEQFLTFALHHSAYWYSGPAAYYLCNIIGSHLFTDHCLTALGALQLLLNLLDILFKSYQLRVANLCYTFVIAFTLHTLSFELEILHLLLVLLNFVNKSLFAFPLCAEVVLLILQLCNLLVELLNLRLVVLTLNGLTFNFQLLQVTGNLIQLLRHRVTLHTELGCGFIHQVDSLIREESVRDVSLG